MDKKEKIVKDLERAASLLFSAYKSLEENHKVMMTSREFLYQYISSTQTASTVKFG